MRRRLVESLSYAGIAVLGAWLVLTKGRRFVAALMAMPRPALVGLPTARFAVATAGGDAPVHGPDCGHAPLAFAGFGPSPGAGHESCGHVHGPDPRTLGEGFSWRESILTVVAAGSRPCSGAILVLVFAMAQGLFLTGVAAVVAMSLGTAITTGALASLAVLAKGLALRLARPESRRGLLLIRGLETLAALVVLAAGLSLFLGFANLGGA